MLRRLWEFFFGCNHFLGWPRLSKHSSTGLYRACTDCGQELEVDPETWRPTGRKHTAPVYVPFDGSKRGWLKVEACKVFHISPLGRAIVRAGCQTSGAATTRL